MDVISLYFIASYYYSCRCRNLPLPLDFPFVPLSLGYPFAAAVAVSLTPSTATTVDALRSVLLSRASLFLLSLYLSLLLVRAFSLFLSLHVEGIHSRNSLLRGLFCCNRCCPPPVPARSFRFFCTAPLPSFFSSFRRSFFLWLLLLSARHVIREPCANRRRRMPAPR